MLFVISGKVTREVSASCHKWAKEFEKEIVARLSLGQVQSPLASIVLFPTILNPDIASMPDSSSYKIKRSSMYVSRNLPYGRWVTSSDLEKVDLLAENISSSLRTIKDTRLIPQDREQFLAWVEQARLAIRERLVAQ